jgi:integrase
VTVWVWASSRRRRTPASWVARAGGRSGSESGALLDGFRPRAPHRRAQHLLDGPLRHQEAVAKLQRWNDAFPRLLKGQGTANAQHFRGLGYDATGKRLREWHHGFKTEKEAEKARTRLLREMDEGTYARPSKETFGAFLATWERSISTTVRPTTAQLYRTTTKAYILPRLGTVKLADLTPAILNAFYADLLKTGKRQSPGGLAPKTVRNVHVVIHRALSDAVRWGVVVRNVADLADPPRVPKDEAAAWAEETIRAFLDAAEDDRLFALWRLAALTGMRREEVCGLRWSDVDFDNQRLRVGQVTTIVGSTLQVAEPKTNRSRRTIALDAGTVDALRIWRAHQLDEATAWGSAWKETGLVFTREDGRALHPATITRYFGRLVSKAGLPSLTLHGLRHSHITSLLRARQPIQVVSARAGHSSPAVTLNLYSHVMPGDDEAAAEAAVQAIGG